MILRRVVTSVSLLFPQCFILAMGQDTLVDLASREKARRTGIYHQVRLFTNQDLPRLRSARVSLGNTREPLGETSVPAPSPVEKDGTEERVKKHDSMNRLREAEERLSATVNRLHILQLKHNHLRNLYLNAYDEVQRLRLEKSLNEVLKALQQAEEEEQDARRSWLVASQEATKLGLDPGDEPLETVIVSDVTAEDKDKP